MNSVRKICVFCGSSLGSDEVYLNKARSLGEALAQREITLVFGGSNIGLMGALAKAVMDNSGYAIGVIPRRIHEMVTHQPLSEEYIVESMHERKAMMYDLAQAFIVLPGGLGTMEEFFEVFTWNQLGYHLKPIGILQVEGFFESLLAFLNHMVKEGFVRQKQLDTLVIEKDADRLLRLLGKKELELIDKHA